MIYGKGFKMDIKILSRMEMISDLIIGQSEGRYIVSINDSVKEANIMISHGRFNRCKGMFATVFSDIVKMYDEYPELIVPSKEHIQDILNWTKDKTDQPISVHCHAGISRSSATAFLIGCQQCGDPQLAMKNILDKRFHSPNSKIIEHGAEILNMPEIIPLIFEFNKISNETIDLSRGFFI